MTIQYLREPIPMIQEQNERVLRDFRNGSTIDLPGMFLVYRHSLNNPSVPVQHKYNAALLTTKRVRSFDHPYIWECTLTNNPVELLNTGLPIKERDYLRNDTWCMGRSHPIVIKRTSQNPEKNGKYIPTEISYTGTYVLIDQLVRQIRIPVFHLTQATICLSSTFNRLDQTEYAHWRVSIEPFMPIISPSELARIQQPHRPIQLPISITHRPIVLPQPATTTVAPPSMPQHIVNSYIEISIAREETCPISMAPLTRETASLTPCGHLCARHEAEHWIQGAHSCPVCRSPCSVAQLLVWKQ